MHRHRDFDPRTFQVPFDSFLAIIIAVIYLVTYLTVTPHHIGFFCDYRSIRYPYQQDTVRSEFVIAFIAIFPIVLFGIVETLTCWKVRHNTELPWYRLASMSSVKFFALFWFGVFAQKLIVEVCKVSFGRLRPHFVDVCRPDFSNINCSMGYIRDFQCTNVDQPHMVAKARKSFPSGHTADAFYAAVFLGYYINRRLATPYTLLLRQVVQLSLFAIAVFTSLSRVTDHAHHLSDVIAGALIGTFAAVWMVSSMRKAISWKFIATEKLNSGGLLRIHNYGSCVEKA